MATMQAGLAALDIDELFRLRVGSEAGFGEHDIAESFFQLMQRRRQAEDRHTSLER